MTGGVRLSAGSLRGRVVPVPSGVRPTEGRVREALFDILGPAIVGSRFADLYAGSGAVGLEAASRGARSVVLVDVADATVRLLRRTCAELELEAVEVRRLDLPRRLDRLGEGSFDLVFADPPYAFDRHCELLAGLSSSLSAAGRVVLEHDARATPPEAAGGLALDDRRRYGESALSFYSRAG